MFPILYYTFRSVLFCLPYPPTQLLKFACRSGVPPLLSPKKESPLPLPPSILCCTPNGKRRRTHLA